MTTAREEAERRCPPNRDLTHSPAYWRDGFVEGAEWDAAQQSETPAEADATPDEAFELGRVAGYDEAMREQSETRITDEMVAAETAIERASCLVTRYVEDHDPGDPSRNELASSLNDMIVYLKKARAALVAALEGEQRDATL